MTDDTWRQMAVELRPYPGRALNDLTASVIDTRPRGMAMHYDFGLSQPRLLLQFPYVPDLISIEVRCPHRGLLHRHGPATFIRAVSIGMNLSTGFLKVKLPKASRRRSAEEYDAPISSSERPITVGERPPVGARQLVYQDKEEGDRQRQARDPSLLWFHKQVREATKFVRDLIQKAQGEVTIVDPYLDEETFLPLRCVKCQAGLEGAPADFQDASAW